jgi:hypothetical protein
MLMRVTIIIALLLALMPIIGARAAAAADRAYTYYCGSAADDAARSIGTCS